MKIETKYVKIETKYNIGDKVWPIDIESKFSRRCGVQPGALWVSNSSFAISSIGISVGEYLKIKYWDDDGTWWWGENVFPTEAEAQAECVRRNNV